MVSSQSPPVRSFTLHSGLDALLAQLPTTYRHRLAAIQVLPLPVFLPYLRTPTPLHRNTFNYVLVVTRGRAVQHIGLERFVLTAGATLVVSAGRITWVEAVTPDLSGYLISFENDVLALMPDVAPRWPHFDAIPRTMLPAPVLRWAETLCQALHDDRADRPDAPVVAAHLLAALLHRIGQLMAQPTTGALPRQQQVAADFRQLAVEWATRQHDVRFYAGQLNVSENYLTRCVRATTGQSPKEWLLGMSLLHARLLLQTTPLPIAEVASRSGFADPSYFGRLFRQRVGQTPGTFRRGHQPDLSGI